MAQTTKITLSNAPKKTLDKLNNLAKNGSFNLRIAARTLLGKIGEGQTDVVTTNNFQQEVARQVGLSQEKASPASH